MRVEIQFILIPEVGFVSDLIESSFNAGIIQLNLIFNEIYILLNFYCY